MKIMLHRHPRQDVFEDYAFDRLTGDEAVYFEEHLLICEPCQEILAKTDDYIQIMKAATAAYVAGHSKTSPARRRDVPWSAAAAALLLVTCLTSTLLWRPPAAASTTIVLDSYRGAVAIPQAAPGRPLDLQIDLKEIPPAAGYRVEVVDAAGRRVWLGGPPAHLANGLSKGDYWVRLLTDNGEWLREYSLTVRDGR